MSFSCKEMLSSPASFKSCFFCHPPQLCSPLVFHKDSNIYSSAVLIQFISSKVFGMHKAFKFLVFLF